LLSEIRPSLTGIKNRMGKVHKKLKVAFENKDEKAICSFFIKQDKVQAFNNKRL